MAYSKNYLSFKNKMLHFDDDIECILWRRTAAGAVTNGRRAV